MNSQNRSRDETRSLYSSIRPHRALLPVPTTPGELSEQQDNQRAWSQLLVARILPLVLPPEDLANPCLDVLVSEVFSEIIVHNAICGIGSEPWIIWDGIRKIVDNVLKPMLGSQQRATVAKTSIGHIFWTIINSLSTLWVLSVYIVKALIRESSILARSTEEQKPETSDSHPESAYESDSKSTLVQNITHQHKDQPAVMNLAIWSCLSRFASLERRMPWLLGFLSLVQWLSLHGPGRLCRKGGVLDR